jgi:hypothetical protein
MERRYTQQVTPAGEQNIPLELNASGAPIAWDGTLITSWSISIARNPRLCLQMGDRHLTVLASDLARWGMSVHQFRGVPNHSPVAGAPLLRLDDRGHPRTWRGQRVIGWSMNPQRDRLTLEIQDRLGISIRETQLAEWGMTMRQFSDLLPPPRALTLNTRGRPLTYQGNLVIEYSVNLDRRVLNLQIANWDSIIELGEETLISWGMTLVQFRNVQPARAEIRARVVRDLEQNFTITNMQWGDRLNNQTTTNSE